MFTRIKVVKLTVKQVLIIQLMVIIKLDFILFKQGLIFTLLIELVSLFELQFTNLLI